MVVLTEMEASRAAQLQNSSPEVLVRGVIELLREWGASGADELLGRAEDVTFSMPKELRVIARQ